jgi:hypothetical protein
MRLNGLRTRASLRFKCEFRRWIETATQRQIGESLLRDVGVLVALVRTERVECSYAKNPNDAAEDIRLFVIYFNQFSSVILHKFNGRSDVKCRQTFRQRDRGSGHGQRMRQSTVIEQVWEWLRSPYGNSRGRTLGRCSRSRPRAPRRS